MAPEIQYHGFIQPRNETPPSNATLSDNEILALEAVSLSFATISVFAAFVAFYWFVRMRRSFRQDLIMLLIQSDMMKAFWLMLCPIVYFISGPDGPINTGSGFCQLSGFLLTAAVEASDIAVLMIALHSALYILRPQRSGGDNGLYPYRRYAYGIWLVVPIVLSALVPLTGARFENIGPFCYLPTRPLWYRAYLNWIPRYIIFGVIFLVYAFLYIHVAWRFRRLRKDQRRVSMLGSISPAKGQRQKPKFSQDLPPTPQLAYNGLLDSSPRRTMDGGHRGRQPSITSDVSFLKLDDGSSVPLAGTPEPPMKPADATAGNWTDPSYDISSRIPQQSDRPESTLASPTDGSFALNTPEVLPTPTRPDFSQSTRRTAGPSHSTDHSIRRAVLKPFGRRPASLDRGTTVHAHPTVLGILHRRPAPSVTGSTSSSPSLSLSQSVTEDALRRSRAKMNRQLRLLFIYPLIYILAWIAPFASHVYKQRTLDDASQPYPLFIASVASLCIGAAVDCSFFSAWEKPWRHLKGGFWEGLAKRVKLGHHVRAGGRTREEELRDATTALDRRNRENADREAAAALTRARPVRQPREWWDVEEEDESRE
ncbi:hypothetical protein JX265_003363 [Neoarthrinium moseri]|uniref:G protein-coupled receptor GPR1 n=1 Tax=Neoarthrinium moseri TaxID=1658444 RepID=A0A9Q0AS55_9PEZI|nr:hypothetical protein JX265_003363 [Neoarthrinium moseri]